VPDAAVHAVVEEHVSADLPVSNKFDMFGQKNNFDMRNQILISVPIFPVCMFFLNEMCKN
jgi:hypothetical protein